MGVIPVVSTVIAVCLSVGAIFAFLWMGFGRMTGDLQTQTIKALKERVEQLEKEVSEQKTRVSIIRYALKQQGIEIAIDGEFVTISEQDRPKKRTIRVRTSDTEEASKLADSNTVE